MRQMGEMIVEEPVVGSFSYFAQNTGEDFPVFIGLELLGSVHFGCHDRSLPPWLNMYIIGGLIYLLGFQFYFSLYWLLA